MNKVVIILLALTALMMVGCEVKQQDGTYKELSCIAYTVDSCQYVGFVKCTQRDYIAHKGNCRFCEERDSIKWEKRKKELEELVIKLKEK